MTNLKYAREHYPIGTRFKSAFSGNEVVLAAPPTVQDSTMIYGRAENGGDFYLYYNGKWAEIINNVNNNYEIY